MKRTRVRSVTAVRSAGGRAATRRRRRRAEQVAERPDEPHAVEHPGVVGVGEDDLVPLKEAAAAYIERRGGPRYDGRREIVITSGDGDAMVDPLLYLTDRLDVSP